MKRKLFATFSMLFMLFSMAVITSCTDETEDKESTGKPSNKPFIILGTEKVDAANTAGTYTVDVETNIVKLDVTSSQEWCKATYDDKKITLQVAANEDTAIRTAKITVKGETIVKELTVSQSGVDPFLEISLDKIDDDGTGGTYEVEVDTNIADIKVTSSETWCVATYENGKITAEIEANPSIDDRTAVITVKGADITKTIAVTQEGIEPFMNLDTTELEAEAKEAAYEVKVDTNITDVTVASSESWCVVTYENGKITVEVGANPDFEDRTAEITVKGGEFTETIKVTQVGSEPYLDVEATEKEVKFEESTFEVKVDTNIPDITVTSSESWCEVSYENGKITIKVTTNSSFDSREAIITVEGKDLKETIKVTQKADVPYLDVKQTELKFGKEGGSSDIDVETNISEVTVTSNDEWIEATYVDGKLTIKVSNGKLSERTGTVTVKAGEFEETVTVTQEAKEPNREEDLLVKITDGWTNSFQPGGEIWKAFDGDFGTQYHSNWNEKVTAETPAILEFYFEGDPKIHYLVYHPRSNGGNGVFGQLEVWAEANGQPLTKCGEYDFKQASTPSTVMFDKPLEKVQKVRFVVKSGKGGFASCAEMEFFTDND